jgi:polynucleotide 5'-hydroxyl-kinase GRC3/NOL9
VNRIVDKGKTLLVDGPASVTVNSGKTVVFGLTVNVAGKVVIREGKRLPFEVLETVNLEISAGENASVEEVNGSTIPPSWVRSVQDLLDVETRPTTAIVLGRVDAGKSSFCTFLINRLLEEKKRVAILDGDLGQSDIGPPSTIAYAPVTKPVTDLFNLRAKNAFFIGETSPSNVTGRMVQGLSLLKKEALVGDPEFLIINTDGWIEGECAVDYKLKLIEELGPQVIYFVQQKDELGPMLEADQKGKKVMVESPITIGQRDQEKRKGLRELGYKKYLRNPKVQSLSLSWVKVEGNESFVLNKSHMNARDANKIYELLGMKPLQMAEFSGKLGVIIGRRRWINSDNIKKVEEFVKKKVTVTRKGDEEGLLAAMYNGKRKFLGVGIVQEIDYVRRTVKVCTPVSDEVAILALGKVKLDKNMKEIPMVEENHIDFASFKQLF